MRALRHILAVLLIAVVAANAAIVPAFALAPAASSAAAGCHCPKSDCAKDMHCANVVCASICANGLGADLTFSLAAPVFAEAAAPACPDNGCAAFHRPPPLPPPRT